MAGADSAEGTVCASDAGAGCAADGTCKSRSAPKPVPLESLALPVQSQRTPPRPGGARQFGPPPPRRDAPGARDRASQVLRRQTPPRIAPGASPSGPHAARRTPRGRGARLCRDRSTCRPARSPRLGAASDGWPPPMHWRGTGRPRERPFYSPSPPPIRIWTSDQVPPHPPSSSPSRESDPPTAFQPPVAAQPPPPHAPSAAAAAALPLPPPPAPRRSLVAAATMATAAAPRARRARI